MSISNEELIARENVQKAAQNQANENARAKILNDSTLSGINYSISNTSYTTVVKGLQINDYQSDTIVASVKEYSENNKDNTRSESTASYNYTDSTGKINTVTSTAFSDGTFERVKPNPIGVEDSFNNSTADNLLFEIPEWGIENYITDRNKWIKGVRSIADEPGYFYFKVFFKFNTNYGLFGGILTDESGNQFMSSNSALRYLNGIKGKFNGRWLYSQEQIPMRINALFKFTTGLSKINSEYPWLIKGISGLDQAMNVYTSNFTEERSIELMFNQESTDMKIISLLNLYKYACYDDINCKEIIPSNLRKFDMIVVIYHVPIKHFQTAIMVAPKKNLSTGVMGQFGSGWAKAENIINKTFNFLTTKSTYYKYKQLNPTGNDYSNSLSFQMFTFQNCEFDVSSFGKYFESAEMKNEQAFQFSESGIKIKYDRVYYHNMNEWNKMFYGSDGFRYDASFPDNTGYEKSIVDNIKGSNDNFGNRLQSLKQAYDGRYFYDKNATQYKSLIEYSESLINDGLMSMEMKDYYSFIDGNIYGKYGARSSEYFKNKLEVLHSGNIKGNLYGKNLFKDGENNQPSYFKQKMKWLSEGTINKDGIVITDVDSDGKADSQRGALKILFNKAPDDIFQIDPIKTKKKEIWNYGLTGSSKSSSIGSALETAQNLASFWKW